MSEDFLFTVEIAVAESAGENKLGLFFVAVVVKQRPRKDSHTCKT
jgi:hypothetical protein